MSQMIIKVIDVEQGKATSKAGKPYDFLDVSFKNMTFQEKIEAKKIFPFGAKEVFSTLQKAGKGDVFTVLREKDKDGYWQWVGIAAGEIEMETSAASSGYAAPGPKPAGVATKSTFETPEERAKKQVYIIKQSSIGHAIEILKTDKKNPTVEEVLHTADALVDYVLGINLDADPAQVNEDIPY